MGNENNIHCKWADKQYARETKLTGRKQFNELFIIWSMFKLIYI